MDVRLSIQGRITVVAVPPSVVAPLSRRQCADLIAGGHARVIADTHNRITDIGLQALTGMLAGGFGVPQIGVNVYNENTIHDPTPAINGGWISGMKITAHPFGALTPPANADNALQGVVVINRTVVGVPPLIATFPAVGEVNWQVLIGAPDYNGMTFTEEGLFLADGQLAARTTFQALKTGAYGLQFDHSVSITRI